MVGGLLQTTGAAWGCSAIEELFVSLREKSALRPDQHPTQDRSLSCVARMRGTVAQQVVVPQSAPRYPHAGCPVAFGSCKHVSRILSRQSRGSTELGAISLREIVAQIRKLFCGLRSSRCPVSFVVFHTLFREDDPRSLHAVRSPGLIGARKRLYPAYAAPTQHAGQSPSIRTN